MLRTLMGKLKFLSGKSIATITASGTGDVIDLQNYGSCAFLVSVGAMAFSTADKLNLKIMESDDGTTFTASTDVQDAESGTIAKALDSTAEQNSVHALHYKGHKRYVRLDYDEVGTVSVALGVTAVLGHPKAMPPV